MARLADGLRADGCGEPVYAPFRTGLSSFPWAIQVEVHVVGCGPGHFAQPANSAIFRSKARLVASGTGSFCAGFSDFSADNEEEE